jgi:hypothetical protein
MEEDKTDVCMFCKKRHSHGDGDGHRLAHCDETSKSFTPEVTLRDGTTVRAEDGYVLKEY